MNFAQILARLENMNAEIFLARSSYTYLDDKDRWSATIEIKNSEKGMELKARGSGADVEDALKQAWGKVGSIVNSHTFSQGFDIPLLTVDADVEREPAF
jgi:hypothetical protein